MFLFLLSFAYSLILSLRYSLILFLKCLLASSFTLFRLTPFISPGSCNNCSLACFLRSNNFEHPSSNHGFDSWIRNNLNCLWLKFLYFLCKLPRLYYYPYQRLSFSKLRTYLTFQSDTAFLPSTSFNFSRLNLSIWNLYVVCLLSASLSLTFATTELQLYFKYSILIYPNTAQVPAED